MEHRQTGGRAHSAADRFDCLLRHTDIVASRNLPNLKAIPC